MAGRLAARAWATTRWRRPGQPRLNALRVVSRSSGTEAIGAEIALLPNSVYFNPLSTTIIMAAAPATSDPFAAPILSTTLVPLNRTDVTRRTVPYFNYPTFAGPGGVNESYDAADFQNMFLALQTVTPRAQGRVVQDDGGTPVTLSVDRSRHLIRSEVPAARSGRPAAAVVPSAGPGELLVSPDAQFDVALDGNQPTPDQRVLAILQPYDANGNLNPAVGGLTPQLAALITAIKRQSSLRPLREDHPQLRRQQLRCRCRRGLPTHRTGRHDTNDQHRHSVLGSGRAVGCR